MSLYPSLVGFGVLLSPFIYLLMLGSVSPIRAGVGRLFRDFIKAFHRVPVWDQVGVASLRMDYEGGQALQG